MDVLKALNNFPATFSGGKSLKYFPKRSLYVNIITTKENSFTYIASL